MDFILINIFKYFYKNIFISIVKNKEWNFLLSVTLALL